MLLLLELGTSQFSIFKWSYADWAIKTQIIWLFVWIFVFAVRNLSVWNIAVTSKRWDDATWMIIWRVGEWTTWTKKRERTVKSHTKPKCEDTLKRQKYPIEKFQNYTPSFPLIFLLYLSSSLSIIIHMTQHKSFSPFSLQIIIKWSIIIFIF